MTAFEIAILINLINRETSVHTVKKVMKTVNKSFWDNYMRRDFTQPLFVYCELYRPLTTKLIANYRSTTRISADFVSTANFINKVTLDNVVTSTQGTT